MSCADTTPVVPGPFTVGDLEDPLVVRWNEPLTTETSEVTIDRPSPHASITIAGVLTDATIGAFEYAWSTGDLVAGEGQLVKARLYRAGSRRKSTAYFKINVQADIT